MMFFSQTASIVAIVLASLLQGFTNGQVLINEVSVTSIPNVCSSNDYVELINTGGAAVNLSRWMLYDSDGPTGEDAFVFPPQVSLAAGEIRLLCRNSFGSFRFGIDNPDNVTLANAAGVVVATTGPITAAGSSATTYQLLSNGTWVFDGPTPGTINGVTPTAGRPIITEVAFSSANATPCFGAPFVEIFNDAFAAVNLAGYQLFSGTNTYTIPSGTLNRYSYVTVCVGAGILVIGANDNVALSNPQGIPVSTTGPIGGSSPRPISPSLSWVRVIDQIITSAPFTPFYQYTTTPTPNANNIYPFVPVQLPTQPCGVQAAPLSMASDYVLKSLTTLNVNGGDPELSGGAFDPRTCNHFSVGDNGQLVEVSIVGSTATLVRARPLIGGSRASALFGSFPDSEGVCFYRDALNGDKLVYTDERDRSVHICDIPGSNQLFPLFRDSTNCRVAKLTPAQIANNQTTNAADNGSFEAVACDPANGKIYVGNEESPMIIWSLDYATGVYSVLIDVQRLPEWTSKIIEISGMAYDPIGKHLYVLSAESKTILQSTLNGTLVGGSLSVAAVADPGGLSFEPTTGDLIIFGEPRDVARYSKRLPTASPTKVPTRRPTKAPTKRPTKAPTKRPTKAPTKAPVANTTAPVTAPTKPPVRPNCGLLNLNIFCPLTGCGLFGRLLGLCQS